jgi:SAM-dependent methyltransferase
MPATQEHTPRIWTGDDESLPDPPRWLTHSPEAVDQLYLRESFRLPSRNPRRPTPVPFTRAWFEQIEHLRYSRHGAWIPRVLEFGRHAGETLLCLGDGMGTDWLQYARQGAHVIACSHSSEQLGLIETNFRLREHEVRLAHAPPHALPFVGASIDVVCIQGLLQEVERPDRVIDEVYRVLRPGGKVIAVAPAKFDAAYWQAKLLPLLTWLGQSLPGTIGGTTARALKHDFARFSDHSVKKRHLRRSNLPQLWRPFPLPLLERIIGQFLILKAFKPVSAALGDQVAA